MKFKAVYILLLSVFSAGTAFSQTDNPEPTFGYLHFTFNVDTAYVQLGMFKPVIHKVANDDTLKVKNGFYHIYFSYPTNEDTYVTQNVLTDSLYSIHHDFDLSKNQIDLKSNNASIRYIIGGDIVVLTDSDTDIYFNGEYRTKEFGVFSLSNKKNAFTLKNEEFYPVDFTAQKEASVVYKKYNFYPTSPIISALSLIPGISQLKRKEHLKAALILGVNIASAALFIKYQSNYGSHMAEYESLRGAYLNASTEAQAFEAGNEMEAYAQDLQSLNIKRNIALWGIIGAVVYDLFDKVRVRKKMGFRKMKNVEVYLAPEFESYLSVGAKLKF